MSNKELLEEYLGLYDKLDDLKEADSKLHIFPNNIIKIGLIIDMIELGAAFKVGKNENEYVEILTEKHSRMAVPLNIIKGIIGQNYTKFEEILKNPENNNMYIDQLFQEEVVQEETEVEEVTDSTEEIAEEETDWTKLPKYYEEGETKQKDHFIFEKRLISVTEKSTGNYETYEVCVYPEYMPRSAEDKIRTVVTVKNGNYKNVFIGMPGVSTKAEFFGGKCMLGFRIVVQEDGSLLTKTTIAKGKEQYSIAGDVKKKYNGKVKDNCNSHMIVTIKGQDVHVFPIDYENNDMSGMAETVALVGEERRAIVPEKENLIPIDGNDGIQTKVKFYWNGDLLKYDI